MGRIIAFVVTMCMSTVIFAQHTLKVQLTDASDQSPLIGATVYLKELNKATAADLDGMAEFQNLLEGSYTLIATFVGYTPQEMPIQIPTSELLKLSLSAGEELEEIVVEATRSNKSIAKVPTRVEVLTDEIEEAATMDPHVLLT